jgi:DNA primase
MEAVTYNMTLIEKIKLALPIEAIVGEVVEPRNGKGRCPFHEDKTPSFSIKGDRFKCFGCGESGDMVDFVKRYYGLDTKG